MSRSGFNKRTTWILVGTLGGAFVISLLAALFLGESVQESPMTNTYSKSSIGHELFVETLKELGYDVKINRRSNPGKDIDGQLVVFAEPDFTQLPERNELNDILKRAGAVLLILPKRTGVRLPENPKILQRVEESRDSANVLAEFMPQSSLVNLDEDDEVKWQVNHLGIEPVIENMRLAVNDDLHPLIATKDGTLFGRDGFYNENLFVLSDPDIIATHGFTKGENAELAVQIIHDILPEGAAIVFDETSHGFALSASFWQEMFRYPLSLITFNLIFILLVLVWVASHRLGKAEKSPPAIPPGKHFLLENVVRLMSHYRHDGFMAERYIRNLVRGAARKLRIVGSDEEIKHRLEKISRTKGIEFDPEGWRKNVHAARGSRPAQQRAILKTVRQAHRWKKEMLDES